MSHLAELIHHRQHTVVVVLGPHERPDEVDADDLPWPMRYGQRLQQPCRRLLAGLHSRTHHTSLHVVLYVLLHAWPVAGPLQLVECLPTPQVSPRRCVMRFEQKLGLHRTVRGHIEAPIDGP